MVRLVNELDFRAHKKLVGGIKDKIMSIFKTNATKDYSKPAQVKNLKNHIIKNRSLFGQSKTE